MIRIGYHCSHENHAPSALLRYAQIAEDAGFDAAMCSDHIAPWREDGQSGFAWSWLGAALQATGLSFGMVNAPGQRYHPAIIAQAAATLAEMFPDRLWCCFGTGQLANEHITGEPWPAKAMRKQRLEESVQVIRRLWAGETVTHMGLVKVQDAKVYSRPQTPPMVYGAAISPETAEWVAGWADGAITTGKTPEQAREWIEAFQRGGGAGKPMVTQVLCAYHPDEERARREVWEQWRTNIHGNQAQSDIYSPQIFDAVSAHVRPQDMDGAARISSSLDRFYDWFAADIDAGFDRIYIYSGTADQELFLRDFGRHVLPALREHAQRRAQAASSNGAQQADPQARSSEAAAGSPLRASALSADVPKPRG